MSKTIVIAGATGLVGSHIIDFALKNKYKIRVLTRKKKLNQPGIEYFTWNPANQSEESIKITSYAINSSDILINLAGTSIAKGRFSNSHMDEILNSRIQATTHLTRAYKKCKKPPGIWAQSSAAGYYGDTGNNDIFESHKAGDFFLSHVCIEWENTLLDFQKENPKLKIIIMRFGLVLAKDAPAWNKLLLPVKLGIGGPIGKGDQWYSWIDADEIPLALFYLLSKKTSEKIFNFTSPSPVLQKDMVRLIAKRIKRPSFFPNPAFLVRLILGKGADELILASCKAIPKNLMDAGYEFKQNTFEEELNKLLK